jgi:RNA polymerase sigma factor (sigma-70 family)
MSNMIISLQNNYLIRFVILSPFLSFQTFGMSSDFKDFINLLDSGNQEAWDIMRFEMEQIIEHSCKEGLIEMLWVSDGMSIPKNKTQFFDEIFNLVREKLADSLYQLNNFKELKNFILAFSISYIHNGFKNFITLLPQNHDRAWWRLDKDLKTKLVYWLISAKRSSLLEAEQIYYDALVVFTQAVHHKKLDFPASRNLKSYIFRIAELKMMEMDRENQKLEKTSNFEMHKDLSLVDELYDEELDLKIENLLTRLETQEREILFGNYFRNENLKTIAARLGITEENCRVIKFRALKKMRTMVEEKNFIDAFK